MTKAAPPVKEPSQDCGTKMSSIVDESMDRMVSMVSQESINMMYSDYAQAFGSYPSESDDPSDLQLSAVVSLISDGLVPYTDFAVFGAHNKRLLKKLSFVSFAWDPAAGTFRKRHLPGPPTSTSGGIATKSSALSFALSKQ